jgi:nucleoside 2-deoxyribosyltransferase
VGNVFVSHRVAEQDDADHLREMLRGRWDVVTHAVSPAEAETWQRECRRLIESADAVIVIVGDRTAESSNVDWELETALGLARPVLAVRAARSARPALPAPIVARGSALLEPDAVLSRLDEVALERTG